jgi:hypothetical protein
VCFVWLYIVRRRLTWHYKKYQADQTVVVGETYGVVELGTREKQLGLWNVSELMAPLEW